MDSVRNTVANLKFPGRYLDKLNRLWAADKRFWYRSNHVLVNGVADMRYKEIITTAIRVRAEPAWGIVISRPQILAIQ